MESQTKFRPDPKLKLMDQGYHHFAYTLSRPIASGYCAIVDGVCAA